MKVRCSNWLVDMMCYLFEYFCELVFLKYFGECYGLVKFLIFEDLSIIWIILVDWGVGCLEILLGVFGGVCLMLLYVEENVIWVIDELVVVVNDDFWFLFGGYVYLFDLLGCLEIFCEVGCLVVIQYVDKDVDVVMIVEIKGILIVQSVVMYLNKLFVIVWNLLYIIEGLIVLVNYVLGLL